MTPERLREIEERASKATEGPWEHGSWSLLGARPVSEVCTAEGMVVVSGSMEAALADDDLRFISHARKDVPDLVAEVKALRAMKGIPLGQLWDFLEAWRARRGSTEAMHYIASARFDAHAELLAETLDRIEKETRPHLS